MPSLSTDNGINKLCIAPLFAFLPIIPYLPPSSHSPILLVVLLIAWPLAYQYHHKPGKTEDVGTAQLVE